MQGAAGRNTHRRQPIPPASDACNVRLDPKKSGLTRIRDKDLRYLRTIHAPLQIFPKHNLRRICSMLYPQATPA